MLAIINLIIKIINKVIRFFITSNKHHNPTHFLEHFYGMTTTDAGFGSSTWWGFSPALDLSPLFLKPELFLTQVDQESTDKKLGIIKQICMTARTHPI